jgi:hypothetical protein
MLVALTILKAVLIITGMAFISPNLIRGFINKDKQKLKKGAIYFFATCIGLVVITAIEFVIIVNK